MVELAKAIRRLNHVQNTIPTDAEEAARAFYCRVLGLPEIEKPELLRGRGGFWLVIDDMQIHVGTEDGFDHSMTKAHLAYEVDDLAYWQQRLHDHGIKMLEAIPIPGYDRFEARDPFGNRFEFIQPLTTE